jgi:hypothetical protein
VRSDTFWRQFFPLFWLGAVGVLALPLLLAPQVDHLARERPEVADVPRELLNAGALLQSAFLLAIAVAGGACLAMSGRQPVHLPRSAIRPAGRSRSSGRQSG